VHRKDLPGTLARLVRLLMDRGTQAKAKPKHEKPKPVTMPVPTTPPDVPAAANEDVDPRSEKDAAE
jgi:hypothetical protein